MLSSKKYFRLQSSSAHTYKFIWSGSISRVYFYKGAGSYYASSYLDDGSKTYSNFTGDYIIGIDPDYNGTVDFMIHRM